MTSSSAAYNAATPHTDATVFPAKVLPCIADVWRQITPAERWRMRVAIFCQGLGDALGIAFTFSLKLIVDGLTLHGAGQPVAWTPVIFGIGVLLLTLGVRNGLYRLRDWLVRYSHPAMVNTLRRLLFKRLLTHSQNFTQSHFSGALANHIRRIADSYNILFFRYMHGFQGNGIILLSTSLLAGTVSIWITPLIWLWALLILGCMWFISPKMVRLSHHNAEAYSDNTGFLADVGGNLVAVRQHARQQHELDIQASHHAEMDQRWRRFTSFNNIVYGVFHLALSLLLSGCFVLVAFAWQRGTVTPGDIAMLIWLLASVYGGLMALIDEMTVFYENYGVFQENLATLAQPIDVRDVPAAPALRVPHGELIFENIRFAYPSGHPVFEGFNLTIPAGQRVGLVGFSGAGKTTLGQLLLRGYDLNGGRILIDGQDIAEVTQNSLREKIAIIPQDPSLFHRSLRDNIAYGKLDATDDEVVQAAKLAQAHGFISQLDQGYQALVGERGVKLSGGQRQRIAIARAILKNAPILLLDEATSALDSETEQLIQGALHQAMQGRTTIVIAHRLATLAQMDRLVVIDQGKVVEDGTQAELLSRDGHFAQLWRLQAGGFLPDKRLS
jgi:ATP-binding cassette subfamily B protein